MHRIIENLNWRYATKKYDKNRNVSPEDLEIIKESLRLTASSYGLQPVKFVIVTDQEKREQLVRASFGQRQVAEASLLIVICVIDELNDKDIEAYMDLIAGIRGTDRESLATFENLIKHHAKDLSITEMRQWISSQAYIVLGQLLATCAELRIDSTPMEGFVGSEYDQILNLSDKNLRSVLACPIGYRHDDDPAARRKKVRKAMDDLFEEI